MVERRRLNLNSFASDMRLKILSELKAGLPPSIGEYSDAQWKEARSKGQPQLGTTRYEPNGLVVEFIFPDPQTASTVLAVRIPSLERIVFMPVPSWVVESIWEGEINGSFQFESEANQMLAEFESKLSETENPALFGPKAPTKRS